MSLFSRKRREAVLPPLHLTPAQCTTEESLATEIAQQAAELLANQGLYVYWLDPTGKTLHLRATRTPAAAVAVRPDYSGLVEDTGKSPVPLSLEPGTGGTQGSEVPRVWGAADEPWLDLPVGRWLLLRYRLTRRTTLLSGQQEALARWSRESEPLVAMAHALVAAHHEEARLRSLVQTGQTALETLFQPESAAAQLLALAATLFQVEDAAVVVAATAEPGWRIMSARGRGSAWWEALRAKWDRPWPGDLTEAGWQSPEGDSRVVVAVPVALNGEAVGGIFLFLMARPVWDEYRQAVIQTLADRVAQLLAQQELAKEQTAGYLATLRALVTAMDSLTPQSAGHSERVARYSRLIARELGLTPPEEEAVALAAFLHDVGMVTIPPELVLKPSRLTAAEYEQVQNHAEMGAHLVGGVQAALPIAPMVASHHERWDGLGYPRGLSGEEIPLGARIIAVADAFEAKTTGRPYRQPLPFGQALEDLQAAAGSQLDPQMVAALVRTFERLRSQAEPGRPLRPCWELKQLAPEVCGDCPNRQPAAIPCWEEPGRLCHRHGDTCSTCVVFTEALTRAQGLMPGAPAYLPPSAAGGR